MAFEPAVQQQIVIAAATVAGPNANDGEVKAHAERIAGYCMEGSIVMQAFAALDQREQNTSQVKSFPATILGVDHEVTSTRGVVFLKTRPSDYHPNGQEFSRTERTDSEAGRQMALMFQRLIGHKVFVTVAVERGNGANTRVIRSVEDKGIDPEYNTADPRFVFDYNSLDHRMRAKLATQQQQQPATAQQQPVAVPVQPQQQWQQPVAVPVQPPQQQQQQWHQVTS